MPGLWECPKCPFVLSRTTLDVNAGVAGTSWEDRQVPEMCPNACGVQLVQVTWESGYKTLIDRAAEAFEQSLAAQQKIEDLERLLVIARTNRDLAQASVNELMWRPDGRPWLDPRVAAKKIEELETALATIRSYMVLAVQRKVGIMPLFECTKCHVVDNTALTNFWMTLLPDGGPALCSECDLEIGKWHGQFPRTPAAEYIAKYGRKAIEYPANKSKER